MQYVFFFVKISSLRGCFSDFGGHQNHLEGFLLIQIAGSPGFCSPRS